MLHDPGLTSAPHRAPPLDPRRALELEMFIGHIDRVLTTTNEVLPFNAARRFLARLDQTGAAQLHKGETADTIQMLGVSARASGSAYALLRNWQSAAWARLEGTNS